MIKMNKVIIVNKDSNMTSRDVINRLNKIFHTKKIGHTGTLDPIAQGVLVVCINQATKLCELLTATYKEYIAEIKLGILTDTLDITGKIIKEEETKKYTEEQIQNVLNSFLHKSMQEVPLYSAVKIKGKKLYEYARNNIDVKLPKRQIEIKKIELLSYKKDLIKFKVSVSKGTYIRSLIKDICSKLNTIGTMNSLIRIKQGDFSIENSYSLKDIENNNYHFLSLKEVLNKYLQIEINDEQYFKIKNGQKIANIYNQELVVFLYHDEVIAIYKSDHEFLKPFKMFVN